MCWLLHVMIIVSCVGAALSMGRTVVAEPDAVDGVNASLQNEKSGIGIIIGQLTLQKDYVVHLARTPCEEEENKSKPISLDKVDEKWIATHARQVLRMLTGGLNIIGVFAYGPPESIKNAQPMLRKAVFAVHKVETKEQYQGGKGNIDTISDRYVLQICSMTKKVTGKTFDASDPKCAGKPADYKTQSFLDKWSKLEMSLLVGTSFSVKKNAMSVSVEKQMQEGFVPLMDNIINSMSIVNGVLRDPNEPLISTSGTTTGGGGKKKRHQPSTLQENFRLNLLCGPIVSHSKQEPTMVDCVANMAIKGTLYGVAFVHNKGTVKEATYAIKQDFVRSLQARYELLCEDLLQSEESNDAQIIYEMPIRVFSRLNGSNVTLCDYLFAEEELKYSTSRFSEFLDLLVDEDSVDQGNERFPTEEDIQVEPFSPSSSACEGDAARAQSNVTTTKKATNFLVIGLSGAVAALAAAMSYMYLGDQ